MKRIFTTYAIILASYTFAQSFSFATYGFFLASSGLNLLQVNLVNVFFMIAVTLFEFPTGVIADNFGRKNSVVIGFSIDAIGFLIYFLSHSFWGFVCAEVTLALGHSFVSGAFDAWLIDSLNNHNQNHGYSYRKIFSYKRLVTFPARITGPLIGSLFATINLSLPWLLSSVCVTAVTIIAYFVVKEEYFKHEPANLKKNWAALKNIAHESVKYGLKNRAVLLIMALGMTLVFCLQAPNMYWPIYFKQLHASTAILGVAFSLFETAIVLGVIISSWLLHRYLRSARLAIGFGRLVIFAGLIIAALLTSWGPIFFFFLLHEMGRGILGPATEAYLHENIPGDKRASLASFSNMIEKFGSASGLLLFGLIASQTNIPTSWLISALVLLLTTPLVFWLKEKPQN